MKATGIIRKLDPEGRLTFPKELRESLDIKEKDSIEIYVENDAIILQKVKKQDMNHPSAKANQISD